MAQSTARFAIYLWRLSGSRPGRAGSAPAAIDQAALAAFEELQVCIVSSRDKLERREFGGARHRGRDADGLLKVLFPIRDALPPRLGHGK